MTKVIIVLLALLIIFYQLIGAWAFVLVPAGFGLYRMWRIRLQLIHFAKTLLRLWEIRQLGTTLDDENWQGKKKPSWGEILRGKQK